MVGHARARELLGKAATARRPAHAYLLVGPDRVGKSALARAFAEALNCHTTEDERPCGRCQSCRLFASGGHPDFMMIGRDTEKRRRSIPIEAVRQLQHDASLSAHLGGFKVYVIVDAEDLSLPAIDALLKTLEEPAPRVVLVLTATETGLLPATVVSRCQVVKLGLVASERISEALRARGVEAERADLLAHLAAGRPGWAFDAAADSGALAGREEALAEIAALDAGGRVERLKQAERFAQEHTKSLEVTARRIESILTWWRDVLLVRSGCEELVVNWDRMPQLRERAARLSVEEVRAAIGAIEAARQQLDENVQPRLALELLALSLPRS